MFTILAPQLVQHSSGYKVFVKNIAAVGYTDDLIEAEIEADFLSAIVPIYKDSFKITSSKTDGINNGNIIMRIEEALGFLGIKYELLES